VATPFEENALDSPETIVTFDIAKSVGIETEDELRSALADAYHLFAKWGWTELIFNHITVRIPGPDHHFLINPFGLLFEEVTPENLVKINLKGEPVLPTPWAVNPAGFIIHAAIHAHRPDALCVMHTHTIAGMAVAQLEEGIVPNNFQAMQLHGRIGYHPFEGITTEVAEQARLVAALGDHSVLVLRNHGLLSVGRTIGEALAWMFAAEKACQIQIAAASTGRPQTHPDAKVLATVRAQVDGLMHAGPKLFDTIFAALRRTL
jgi:ribulose-5-phosphate 4-epimerase/fuculose-1-phosphate aldolase